MKECGRSGLKIGLLANSRLYLKIKAGDAGRLVSSEHLLHCPCGKHMQGALSLHVVLGMRLFSCLYRYYRLWARQARSLVGPLARCFPFFKRVRPMLAAQGYTLINMKAAIYGVKSVTPTDSFVADTWWGFAREVPLRCSLCRLPRCADSSPPLAAREAIAHVSVHLRRIP